MSLRTEKVNELLRHEVSRLLFKKVDLSHVFITVIGVETSPDLRQAKVKISVIPAEKKQDALKIISRNIFDIQQEINKKLYMKPVPKLRFEIDKVEEKAQQIEKLLGKIKSGARLKNNQDKVE
ncbi:MAG: ribosome-binding factor A [Candidatus Portnoybacteria bacterium CG_4_8_14_3_um_filter_44_15]|uniref:Ribosome-binding factor A n=1 Tax=Candidatus Portnoybacteria bacterium CG_4_8_14_3_um_filter_44_15 TaxID=1974803 RepID=A0A2M7IE51_9BACT|nr:MAG: ribosome-binding factor A [Candidatus Portnoybacteria bacterium CG_4_8_14_3_um_filter_44_15]